jgi:hypothetical protein
MTGPPRVANLIGHGAEIQINFHTFSGFNPIQTARELLAEYVPPTATVGGVA